MSTEQYNPWIPMSEPIDIKHLGKLTEETGELVQVICRCLIQGIDGLDPINEQESNRDWLTKEIADVLANIDLVVKHFDLDIELIGIRRDRKKKLLRQWHGMLVKPAK